MIASSSPAQHFFTAFGAGLAAFGVFFLLVGWIIRRTSRHFRGPAERAQGTIVGFDTRTPGAARVPGNRVHVSTRTNVVGSGPLYRPRSSSRPPRAAEAARAKAAKSEPLLSVSHEGAGGESVGSKFVGTLDLTDDPAAQAALEQVLAGNTSQIPVLIAEMNAHGTEYTQSYHLKKSNSTYGGEVNAGGGGGAELSDGGSSACYDPPRVRQNGGPWTTTTWNSNQTC